MTDSSIVLTLATQLEWHSVSRIVHSPQTLFLFNETRSSEYIADTRSYVEIVSIIKLFHFEMSVKRALPCDILHD